jgi:hypothetical protein
MSIVNRLAGFYGYTSFLEISTPTTGREFSEADPALFTRMERLTYNLQSLWDAEPVDYRSDTLDIAEFVAEFERRGVRYDLVLVDPYHDYACSARDLDLAWRILNDNGTIVVHDCMPPHGGGMISPTFVSGSWCGVTFIAYVDFLMKKSPRFVTVDCDYGCGVIRRGKDPDNSLDAHRYQWSSVRGNPDEALKFLLDHKKELLHLQSSRAFKRAHPLPVGKQWSSWRHRFKVLARIGRQQSIAMR